MGDDRWENRSARMRCVTCMYWVEKRPAEPPPPPPSLGTIQIHTQTPRLEFLGRCRRHSPTMAGWPAVFNGDWCGDHKLDENRL